MSAVHWGLTLSKCIISIWNFEILKYLPDFIKICKGHQTDVPH
jgi:hypothetical protein